MFSEDVSCTMVTPDDRMITINYEFVSNDMNFEMSDGEVYDLELNTNQQDNDQTNNFY